MLVLAETFAEQPPGAVAGHGIADFFAGDHAEPGRFAGRQLAPVGNEAAEHEAFPGLPDARETVALREPRGAAQTQAVTSNAILAPAAVAGFSAPDRQLLATRRNNAALLQTLTQSALQQTSTRFSTLQTLIGQIGVATDPKAIADLQGRVQVEQAMLENDSAKLSSLYQLIRAQELVANQQAAEAAVARVGHAATLPAVAY